MQQLSSPAEFYISDAKLAATQACRAINEYGEEVEVYVAGERPLTLYIDKQEIVTLMTLGTHPEALALGYIRNQGFAESIHEIKAVQVDWETDSVVVTTHNGLSDLHNKLGKRTVTSGCGQGTVFGNMMERLSELTLPDVQLRQSDVYTLLHNLNQDNDIYKRAGAVHGCALCKGTERLYFVEDVGRHNAVDAIAGMMWLDDQGGADKVFYTTGRLTSEMVIKVAQMGIPVLLSRSGVTQMGLELARQLGVTMIARAKGRHFNIYNGAERVTFDAIPA